MRHPQRAVEVLARGVLLALLSGVGTAAAQSADAPLSAPQFLPVQYAPANTAQSQWLKVAELPPGTPIVVHQRGYNWPIQCSLVWINPKALACDTTATTVPSQRLVIQASSVDTVHALAYTPPAPPPAPVYLQPAPAPVTAYAPPAPVYSQPYAVAKADTDHHPGVVITFGVVAGALLGGLIGKNFNTTGGFLGAALGGIGGGAISLGVVEAYDRPQPTYPGYRYQHP